MKPTSTLLLLTILLASGACLLVQNSTSKSQDVTRHVGNYPYCYIQPCDDCSGDALACKKCPASWLCCSRYCMNCSEAICSQCQEGYDLVDNLCVPQDPCKNYLCKTCDLNRTCIQCGQVDYLEPRINQCRRCPEGCYSCEDIFNCTSCSAGHFFKNYSCQSCAYGCSRCNDKTQCLECYDSLGLFDGKCIQCYDPYCQNCKLDATSCTECYWYHHFLDKDNTCRQCGTNCDLCEDYESCKWCRQMNDYYNVSQHACVACPYSCPYCQNSSVCISCGAYGHYLNATINPTMCFSCQSEECQYARSHEHCDKCRRAYGTVRGQCVLCTFLTQDMHCSECEFDETTNQTRIVACSEGYYLADDRCKPCPANCKICPNPTQCYGCQNGFIMTSQGECKEGEVAHCSFYQAGGVCYWCFDGYEVVNNVCVSCPPNCKYCSYGPSSCSTCQAGFFKQSNLCQPCLEHCINCYDRQQCYGCEKGYFSNKQKLCELCEEGCLNCTIQQFGLDVDCIQCAEGYVRTNVNGRVGQVCLKTSEQSQVNYSPKQMLFNTLKEVLLNF